MKNTVLISSFLGRGQRWQLVALVALFFAAGCTVELYPPAQEVSNLPDGGKVDVLPDTIPQAFAFGPRMYWSQIVGSDSTYSFAVTGANKTGRWLDSIRWVPSGPFVTVNGDTLSTRAYARDNSGVTGDNQVLTYNGSGSLTIESGNTVDMSDLLDNTDDQKIDTFSLSANILSLSIESDGEAAKTVDLSGYLDNTDAQTIDTLVLQGDTMLQVSLSGDGAPVKELDLSALRSVVDSTRLTQDSILVYYQDGTIVRRDTIRSTDDQTLTYNGSGSLTIENGNTVDMSDLLDNTDDQTIDTFSLSGTTLSLSLESDGQAAQTVDLSALAVIDSTRLAQDSILVYYQDGAEVGRDTIAGVGGGGADNLGDHTMTQNLQTNGNWISGDGGNEGIGVDASGKVGIGTLTPSYILDFNSTDAVRLPLGTTAQNPTGATGLLRYNSDLTAFTGYYNAQWNRLVDHDYLSSTAGQAATNYWTKSGDEIYYSNNDSKYVGIGRRGLSNAKVAISGNQLHGHTVAIYAEAYGQPGTSFVSYRGINFTGSYTPTTNSNNSIIGTNSSVRQTGAFSVDLLMGGSYSSNYNGTGSQLNNSIGGLFTSEHNGSGKVFNSIGGWFGLRSNATSGTITNHYNLYSGPYGTYKGLTVSNFYGIYVDDHNTGTNVIQNLYGLYIEDIFKGTSTNYAIYSAGGQSYHAGNFGIGNTTPTAKLHIAAGTATASTAPLKFTSGTNLTTPEAGAMEWDGTNLYITQTTGPTRKTIAYVDTDDGSASDTTDGSGDITVSHTLGSASITVTATATGTTFYHVQVHTKTSTTFKIRFFDAAGAAVTATAVTADWIAKLQ